MVTKIDEPQGVYDPHKDPPLKNHLPKKYGEPQTTPLAATVKLIQSGRIPKEESIVVSITGNGLKTQEVVQNELPYPAVIDPKLSEFDALLEKQANAKELTAGERKTATFATAPV